MIIPSISSYMKSLSKENMPYIAKRLRESRKELNITLSELSERINIHKSTISRYENMKISNFNTRTIFLICIGLNINIEWVLGLNPKPSAFFRNSGFSCLDEKELSFSNYHFHLKDIDSSIKNCPTHLLQDDAFDFIVRISSNELYPFYFKSDLLFIHQTSSIASNQIVLFCDADNNVYLKKAFVDDDSIAFYDLLDSHLPMVFHKNTMEHIKIIGIVYHMFRTYP